MDIKKPEVSSKMTRTHSQYKTSQKKKKHRAPKKGVTAPYGVYGVNDKHYNF
jgi:hypothetical protein